METREAQALAEVAVEGAPAARAGGGEITDAPAEARATEEYVDPGHVAALRARDARAAGRQQRQRGTEQRHGGVTRPSAARPQTGATRRRGAAHLAQVVHRDCSRCGEVMMAPAGTMAHGHGLQCPACAAMSEA